jgi:hypothetical protein
MPLVDGEDFDLVVARKDYFTSSSADQSLRDGTRILHGNVYGWFARVERGVYGLTESGRGALLRWPQPEITGFRTPDAA